MFHKSKHVSMYAGSKAEWVTSEFHRTNIQFCKTQLHYISIHGLPLASFGYHK